MRLVYAVFAFSMMGLVIPAFADDSRYDEIDMKIREEVKQCKVEIDSDDSKTDAEKTVAKRDCETEINIHYRESISDPVATAELKAKLENIGRCENWYPQFNYLTMEQFKMQKNSENLADCLLLYNDAIWDYVGKDRAYQLVDRLEEIKTDSPPVPQPISILVEAPIETETKIVDMTEEPDKIRQLEKQIEQLETEIKRKDAVIQEQVKTIMDLFNRISKVFFEPFNLPLLRS